MRSLAVFSLSLALTFACSSGGGNGDDQGEGGEGGGTAGAGGEAGEGGEAGAAGGKVGSGTLGSGGSSGGGGAAGGAGNGAAGGAGGGIHAGGTAGASGAAGGMPAGGSGGMNTGGGAPVDPKAKKWVYLMLGQSNMAGSAACEAQDRVAPPRVFKLAKNKTWVPGHESYNISPWSSETGAACAAGDKNMGPSRSFAVNLLTEVTDPEVQIYIINAAYSGSSVEEWDPETGKHFGPMLPYLEEGLKKGIVRGFIWHQGESNGGTAPAQYAIKLGKVVKSIRDKVGNPSLPVVAGEVGTSSDDGNVNLALKSMANADKFFGVATSENLTLNDNVHYDSPSQREFGRRYAQAWWTLARK